MLLPMKAPLSLLSPALLLLSPALAMAQAPKDGIQTKTTYAKAYGETKNAVMVDPAKDLPRYPAVPPKDAAATWQVKKGFKLELAANEPQVLDPIAICFDERGRMFVCEMIDYSEMRDVTPHLGRITMLEDKDGDGFFETSKIFADDLPWPTGLIWSNGGLYVGATPDIWRFEDKNDDGKAEVREKVYTGFGTGLKILNVQGLMNSFQWGQDNRIHVLAGGGNRGVIKCLKKPELKEQELGGKDFWFDPLTHEFGLELGGAQYGMSFDNYGRKFGCSNSDHLQYWLYDDRYTARNSFYDMPPSRRSIAVDGGAAEVFRISPDEPWRIIRTRWRIAGVVKGSVEGGGRVSGYFTGATGTTIYRGDAYGPEFVNNSFSGDAGGQLIHRKIIRYAKDGINLEGERPADERGFEFAASKDTWVRVVNFANAPDGCLYVCDMYREVIEHPWSVPDEIKKHLDLNSGNDRGRIWRIVPDKGVERKGQKVTLGSASSEELVKTLGHTNGWHRDTAQRLLYEKQDKAVAPMLKARFLEDSSELEKIHILNTLATSGALKEDTLEKAVGDTSAQVRERGTVLGSQIMNGGKIAAAVYKLEEDPSPRVRFTYGMLIPEFYKHIPGIAGASAEHRQATILAKDGNNPLIVSAILSSEGVDPLPILEELVHSPKPALTDLVAEGLLSIIGQQKQDKALAFAIKLLAEPATAPTLRRNGLKALAAGLRKGGSSIARADKEGKLAAVFTQASATAQDTQATESSRLQAIELLALATQDQAETALQAGLKAGQSEAIQAASVKSANELLGKSATASLLTAWSGLKPKAREASLAALLARDDGAASLLEAMSTKGGPEPKDLAASQVQALAKHKNASIAKLAATVLKSVIPPSREEVARTFALAAGMKGDAKAGQTHYMTRCLACHQANGLGIEVGPNFTTVKTKGRDALLTAILEPHKEVASQFIAYTVNTKEGQTVQGIITADDANSMTLKMMGGAVVTLQRANIQGSNSAGQSLMPEGLESGLSVQDMADLLSFIEAAN
ncbi:PVC-type heme-binding CxxCH protein [Brevifollis gellanilyticus]|uniref:Cytochrome c n=1 Tax=Brevifollis gellanilyticus TaxID=748831 RepID=A0A512MBG7_9BACT|nr:PVC-type heme-binding CxxCH protein [Brevifollis gellanilyticus]GEP44082.1 cytochrome c [Brevifollis gellanilyticus]